MPPKKFVKKDNPVEQKPKGARMRKLAIEEYNVQWLGDQCEEMMKDLNADIEVLIGTDDLMWECPSYP